MIENWIVKMFPNTAISNPLESYLFEDKGGGGLLLLLLFKQLNIVV